MTGNTTTELRRLAGPTPIAFMQCSFPPLLPAAGSMVSRQESSARWSPGLRPSAAALCARILRKLASELSRLRCTHVPRRNTSVLGRAAMMTPLWALDREKTLHIIRARQDDEYRALTVCRTAARPHTAL